MSSNLLAAALAAYLFSTVVFIAHVVSSQGRFERVAQALLASGFILHLGSLVLRVGLLGYESLAPLQEGLSVIACVAVGLYLLIALRANLAVVGALIAPLAFLFALSAYAFESGAAAISRWQSVWLPAHVIPTFLGYSVFAVAFCLSLTYLLQERQLKAKTKSTLFRRLPSLETLDSMNHRLVSWGFALFSFGLITGSLLARETWGALWSWEPVQIWSLLTWLLYAGQLQARTIGWRGRRAARLTIVGFVILVTSYISVNLVFSGRHGATAASTIGRALPPA